jgi:hypothetical protein
LVYSGNITNLRVCKISDLADKIIPLFKKHHILGVKSLDFEDFCKVAEIIKRKEHLTVKGLAEIIKIKEGMSKGRLSQSS